ncbi:ABC transporter permease [Herpetosiphon llansteffanensis]|uniref:ABC transporter permease n=1 Tax=Herpetosiphon llansteffanensis TaxID=2094568 RepID=UPI0013DFC614|nr:ABC transporter permease [Herpetosiphon llansteffanensis]
MQRFLQAFRVGAWLGWKTESNWTNPLFYILWSLLLPMSNGLIMTMMLRVLQRTGNSSGADLLPYVFIGTVVYSIVALLLDSMAWAVLEDRERMGMLKYIAITPSSMYGYLWGRGFAKVSINFLAVPLTLTFGALVLDIPIRLSTINWPLLLVVVVLGLLIVTFAAQILAGVTLMIARHAGFVGQAVSGALYLFTGALFPITVLPNWMQVIARAVPLTYWLEGMRRALWVDAQNPVYNTGLNQLSTTNLLLILLASAVAMAVISIPLQRRAEHRAKEKGLLDMNTAY